MAIRDTSVVPIGTDRAVRCQPAVSSRNPLTFSSNTRCGRWLTTAGRWRLLSPISTCRWGPRSAKTLAW
ncbi:MAG: hypothetical protein WKG07_37515 [Hymenobacter sp.]